MNTSSIKNYAPLARTQFCNAIAQKLTSLGIIADKKGELTILDAVEVGDAVRFGDYTQPKSVLQRRQRLVQRAETLGYIPLVENMAYTWFNRLCAIRYMEVKGYLDHGFRMLSQPDGGKGFEVLDHVSEVVASLELSNPQQLVEMKLVGDQDEALYRELLLGQCHFLHKAMPFLFEPLNDETELLLPDNLTRTDSILRALVDDVKEEDWEQVEVIGWLYQFYISEKKDQVIGKVVKSEDIPAATQLFTPNWIVQYLVQNSVGRQWLQTYPNSAIKGEMDYYIEPTEQTPEVNAQLAAITPDSIEPESIKVLDPACGSGHILIEAYNVLKKIYAERGYRSREIPQLILENNIYGLDIDDRAAQLSGFALLMMARQDDRRIFDREHKIRLNVLSLQESSHLDIATLWRQLDLHQQSRTGSTSDLFADNAPVETRSPEYALLSRTLALFTQAKTLGSLIQVPQEDETELKALFLQLVALESEGDTHQKDAARILIPFIQQAWLLAQRYDAVIANPPYMGGKGMNSQLKEFAKAYFPESKSDLFAMFMQHAFSLLKENGFNAQVNMQSWMFLSSYEKLREWLLNSKTFITMAHLGARAFGQISGEVVQTTAWVLNNYHAADYQPVFFRLIEGNENEKKAALAAQEMRFDATKQNDFKKIPGAPIAYWVSDDIRILFEMDNIEKFSISNGQNKTANNDLYVRSHWEVSSENIGIGKRWFQYSKGGEFRKWSGNLDSIVDWSENARNHYRKDPRCRIIPQELWYEIGITWSRVSSANTPPSFRFLPKYATFDMVGSSIFVPNSDKLYFLLAALNSKVASVIFDILNPTIDIQVKDVRQFPVPKMLDELLVVEKSELIIYAVERDWDNYEFSLNFKYNQLLKKCSSVARNDYSFFKDEVETRAFYVKSLEEDINRIFIAAYKVSDMFSPESPIEQVTLTSNRHYRYSAEINDRIKENRLQSDTLAELLSYAIGCMMGRYSLDREGLVYAHAGNKGFAELVAEGAYQTFPADGDGILPLMDSAWFDDDITTRVREFVRCVWGEEHLQENLDFIAESLRLYAVKERRGESATETIRRYFSTQFWKDHLKTYKKRPIYWLFSSGKEKAFECLVYLHRYNESTLARMRTEYVVPLLARYQSNIDLLAERSLNTTSTAEKTALKKEETALTRKFNELRSFDDRLRHYADMRISIDLDDGVKVNYGRFGDLLADVKAITGNNPEVA